MGPYQYLLIYMFFNCALSTLVGHPWSCIYTCYKIIFVNVAKIRSCSSVQLASSSDVSPTCLPWSFGERSTATSESAIRLVRTACHSSAEAHESYHLRDAIWIVLWTPAHGKIMVMSFHFKYHSLATSFLGSPKLDNLSRCFLWSTISPHPYMAQDISPICVWGYALTSRLKCVGCYTCIWEICFNPRILKYTLSLGSLVTFLATGDDFSQRAASTDKGTPGVGRTCADDSCPMVSSGPGLPKFNDMSWTDCASFHTLRTGESSRVPAKDKHDFATPRSSFLGSTSGWLAEATNSPSLWAMIGAPGQVAGWWHSYRGISI